MSNSSAKEDFFKSNILGHPAGLFVLFFTEMWERFSYYGMRALLVLFLVSSFGLGGWDWSRENALALFGTYASLVYLTPILGGYIADKYIGYRLAVIIGAIIMTLGHMSMAMEFHHIFLYIGIGLLIIGNGFFKPNMTSIISHMYKDAPEKKDGAYMIFYMGVNAGAFLGILLCGYLGEKVGWSYGFGLAGIFMFLGMLQFYFTRKIFGDVGKKPERDKQAIDKQLEFKDDRINAFNKTDSILIVLSIIIALVWVINDPMSKISGINLLKFNNVDYSNYVAIAGLITFFVLLVYRISRYPKITRDKMIAIVFFAVMTVFFWASFEQAGGTMNIFAKDYTNRVMTGNYYHLFLIVNLIITVTPIAIITWVLYRLFKVTFHKYKTGNIILGFSFLLIWGIVFWMLHRDYASDSYEVSYRSIETQIVPKQYNSTSDRLKTLKNNLLNNKAFSTSEEDNVKIDSIVYNKSHIVRQSSKKEKEQKEFDNAFVNQVLAIDNTSKAIVYFTKKEKVKTTRLNQLFFQTTLTEETTYRADEKIITKKTTIIDPEKLAKNDEIKILEIKDREFALLDKEKELATRARAAKNHSNTNIIHAKINRIKDNEVEIPATWFLILNSLFIICFSPLFSRLWESKYNPSASIKYGLGLILLGIGFGALAFGASVIPSGAKTASVSLIWLVLAYLFHTLGELCLSPVGLSYISKLVPGRMIAMMFGIWYIAIAIGNKLAGTLGGQIDKITEKYDMTTFFLIFTIVPIIFGLISFVFMPITKKLMHGVK